MPYSYVQLCSQICPPCSLGKCACLVLQVTQLKWRLSEGGGECLYALVRASCAAAELLLLAGR